ncbi:hypothetical protein SLEP1_g54854 [Rubroshorea leprosula]|uniref:Uncharacterized protein n=1 Tax=Rubroshorea leprosula TaxID=152421 RepID=A0AAV5MHR6_9ROSI|nr:hypothetical protein SLEP1_g54854 [Rubroshorea leprosula]
MFSFLYICEIYLFFSHVSCVHPFLWFQSYEKHQIALLTLFFFFEGQICEYWLLKNSDFGMEIDLYTLHFFYFVPFTLEDFVQNYYGYNFV